MQQASDAQLLLLYAGEGSASAFRAIVDRHTKLVYSVCYRILLDVQLAEDATQEVFLGFAKRAKHLRPGPVDGYLVEMSYRVSRRMRRKADRRELKEQEFRAMQATTTPSSDPRLAKLQELLQHLKAIYREPVTLRYMEGMSIPSIAVALHISPVAVRKRLLRALEKLRQMMEERGYGLSLAVAAGMLGRIPRPQQRADLAARIAARVLSVTKQHRPTIRLRKAAPLPKIALAAGAATAIGTVVAITLWPWSAAPTASPTPQNSRGSSPSFETSDPIASLSLQQRLSRKIPNLVAQPVTLEFAFRGLQDASGVSLRPDWAAIEAAGISRYTHVTGRASDSTLRDQLDVLLHSASVQDRLEFVVAEDQNAILIRPRVDHSPAGSGISEAR